MSSALKLSPSVQPTKPTRSPPCVEHEPLVRGQGRYLDDLTPEGTLHAAFVRSPYAHARIQAIDTTMAERASGVTAVVTGKRLRALVKPVRALLNASTYQETDWHPLARDKVRYVGEAVAVVVADDRYLAEDAATLVNVSYDPLPVVANAQTALGESSPRVHETLPDNVLFQVKLPATSGEAAFERATVRVSARFKHPRVTGLALENCGVLAHYHPETDELVVWSSTQVPHLLKDILSLCLDQPSNRLRVIAPNVGGAFGVKMHAFPEELVVAHLARSLGRPVKWAQDRMENMQASIHARDDWVEAELAAEADGTLVGLKARAVCDVGAYSAFPVTCALEPYTIATALPGPYRFPYFAYEGLAVATNKCPVGAYRGVGFVMGPLVMEGLMDRLAQTLKIDPAALRHKNLARPQDFPFPSPSGAVYDSGDYPALLRLATEQAGYDDWRDEQRLARVEGRCLGVGMACFVEPTGMGTATYHKRGMVQIPAFDAATLRVNRDGSLEAFVSTPSQGQGQYTTMAQLLSQQLGVPLSTIHVHLGDTASCPYGSGTFASRSMVSGGGALLKAADAIRHKCIKLAALYWESDPSQLEYGQGAVTYREGPALRLTLCELAQLAYTPSKTLPRDFEPGLEVHCAYDPPPAVCSAAVHLAFVEVDFHTGKVKVLRYIVAEDCGQMVNPQVVEGQIRGGVAQGLGIALLEELVYDDGGQLLSSTLMDYLVPSSQDVPPIQIVHLETPSPWSEGGLKGVGESGTIGAPAAITNAVLDAIGRTPNEVRLPLSPERVYRLLQGGM